MDTKNLKNILNLSLEQLLIKRIGLSWRPLSEFLSHPEKGYSIIKAIKLKKAQGKEISPITTKIFRAFKLTNYDKMKVVILGKLPYNDPNKATGLAYAINPQNTPRRPSSIRNIEERIRLAHFEAESNALYLNERFDYTLTDWASQGVLLLNMALTNEKEFSESHLKIWKPFIDFVFLQLNKKQLVYLLVGEDAQKYQNQIGIGNIIINVPDPSHFSKGFGNTDCFIRCNNELKKLNYETIRWI